VTVLEVMPVADFAGRFGWGYDGSTSTRRHASTVRPTTCARSWTSARVGLGVILDVVYNHLGPSGNYLPQFSERTSPTNTDGMG
jgi:maltooligosyltrehalose trehalohydrolase